MARCPEGYVGWVEDIPGANVQGTTLNKACANLVEVVELVLEGNGELAQMGLDNASDLIREPFRLDPAA